MTEMKLEEYFSNISYVRPSQHEYNIIINDKEKVIIYLFNLMKFFLCLKLIWKKIFN